MGEGDVDGEGCGGLVEGHSPRLRLFTQFNEGNGFLGQAVGLIGEPLRHLSDPPEIASSGLR